MAQRGRPDLLKSIDRTNDDGDAQAIRFLTTLAKSVPVSVRL